MMRKKIISIIFILLANIIVLGHTFIPHHHHQREFCIIKSHCQDDSESHKHNNTESSHQHDGDQNTEICILKLFFVIPANQAKPEFKCVKSVSNDDHSFSFQAFHHEYNATNSYKWSKTSVFQQIAIPDYLFDLVNGIGLRAPPTV